MSKLCTYSFLFLYGIWIYFKGTILGRRYDEIVFEIIDGVQNILSGKKKRADASKSQREKFINREMQTFGKLLFDEERDCPICLAEFKEND